MKIHGSLLARNTLINLIGQALPLVVAVVTMPFVVRGLGLERFGILALAWAVLGYFNIFDLGLGRAATKFVAEALGRDEQERVPAIVWTTVSVQAAFGVVGGLILAGITPLLVELILNIPQELVVEARLSFYLLALSFPMVLISSSFRGALEAAQRFDLVNAVRAPFSALNFLSPLVGVLLGWDLPGIVVLLVISRVLSLIILYWLCIHVFPSLKGMFRFHRAELRALAGFSKWLTITNVVVPIFVYLDRFLIGSLLTISAVSYYTVPYEVVSRLLIIPASLTGVLFPAFSSLSSNGDQDELNVNVTRSIKYIATAMMLPTVIFLLFAEDILRIWLGNDFALESASVFRLLSVSVLFNAIGYIPFSLIQGVGRPDIVAKYLLIELPLYAGIAFFLILRLGINGAALAWCLRMGWTIPIFSFLCIKIARVPLRAFIDNGTIRSLKGAGLLLMISIPVAIGSNWGFAITGIFTAALLIGYAIFVWHIIFDPIDKNLIRKLVGQARNFFKEEEENTA